MKDIKEVGYTFDKMEDFYQPQKLALYPDQLDKLWTRDINHDINIDTGGL